MRLDNQPVYEAAIIHDMFYRLIAKGEMVGKEALQIVLDNMRDGSIDDPHERVLYEAFVNFLKAEIIIRG